MRAEKILRNTGLLAASGLVALALAAVPAAPGLDAGFFGLKAAQAKGNGGNGNGGGHGNANGHGKGAEVSGATLDAHGKSTGGHAKGKGNGHGTGLSTEGSHLGAESHGLTASSLGNLNAAHASATAMSNASLNSVVGQIGAAVELAADEDRELAAEDLIGIANKDVDDDVVQAVNELVDGKEVDRSEPDATATGETDEPEET